MSGKIPNDMSPVTFVRQFGRQSKNLELSRVHPETSRSSSRASGRSFRSSKIAFDGVLRNTDFSPTGPSPGTFGGLPGSLDLPSRAAWWLHFFYMVRSTLPPFWHFSKIRVGQIRRPGPMYKKASEGPIFRHIFADIYGSSPPPPHVNTQEIQIGSKLSSEPSRVSGEIRNRLFQ